MWFGVWCVIVTLWLGFDNLLVLLISVGYCGFAALCGFVVWCGMVFGCAGPGGGFSVCLFMLVVLWIVVGLVSLHVSGFDMLLVWAFRFVWCLVIVVCGLWNLACASVTGFGVIDLLSLSLVLVWYRLWLGAGLVVARRFSGLRLWCFTIHLVSSAFFVCGCGLQLC